MTREIALRKVRGYLTNYFSITDYNEVEEIMLALEQQPITWIIGKGNCQVAVRNMPIDKMQKICAIIEDEEQQPCEDCISREDAIKQCGFGMTSLLIADCLRKLPPVTPQPKTGQWILCHPLQADDPGAYACSVCGCGDWGLDPKIDKFCFNCGAKMIEPSESKE